MPWAKKQAALLSRAYGAARFQAVFGSSDETVPSYSSRLPKKASKCDVAFSDGGKTESLRLADLRNFRQLARPQALLLFDEITSLACVRGEGEREDSCGHAWQGTTYAYHRASREGWLRIDRCAWPPGLEGVLHASAHHGAPLPTGAPGLLASRTTMGSAQDAMSHAAISRTRATRGAPRMVTMGNVTSSTISPQSCTISPEQHNLAPVAPGLFLIASDDLSDDFPHCMQAPCLAPVAPGSAKPPSRV